MNERAFVLIPVLEILKKSADCNKKEAIFSSLKKLPEQGVVQCSKTVQEKFLSLTC